MSGRVRWSRPFVDDSPVEQAGFELVWGFSCQVVVLVLLPVLCSEVCPGKASMFSRRQSCRGKSQSPVVRIAEEMETGTFEAYRQDLPRGEHESPGCIKRERIVASKKVAPRAEPTSEGRRQHEQPNTDRLRLFT